MQSSSVRLFPDLPKKANGCTGLWSQWWRYHCTKLKLTDPRKTFHSFRHGFIDAARLVMPESHHDAITGHASGSVSRQYGQGVPLTVLAESMARVRFPLPATAGPLPTSTQGAGSVPTGRV